MANLRSFTGFLALDVLGTQNVAPGLSFTFPGANPLDIIIQDGDALLQGDSDVNDQSADPEGDQIGFVTNSDGEALLDGQEIFVETSFTFTLDGAGSFTGYILENEGSGQSFVVLPPNLAAGTITITATDDTATNIDYALLGSGDEEINQNDFSELDLSGADTINAGGGDDSIDAGEGDDSVSAGGGGDTVFGNAGGDTVDGGAGDDSIRGDSGEDGITAVRESFNWAQLGLNSGDTIPNNADGIDQDTGNITVNIDYTELARFSDVEYRNNFAQFTDGIDTGGEVIGNDIGFFVGDGTSPPGDTVEFDINFSANAAGFEDEVRNVQFRINDLDDLNWRDIVQIQAFDANGDPVHVVLTGGSNITLTDTDGVNGFDTALANDTNTNNNPIDASNSLLVEVPGPVARINFVYGNQETAGQRIDVTDIFFDAVPTAIANVETGDDSLLGGSGDDTIFGEAGEDTIDGGTDDDSVEGGAGDDLLQLNDDFGNDTITGGEIGETTGDTLDGGALTEAVNVVYSGNEAGDAANAVTGDSAAFSEIEHINTGSGDDTIDGTLDAVGIDLNAGAGADTILGGQAGDTLNAGSGADTIDGQAGDDTINAGDDADEIRLTDGFDNDSIIGGEGGNDSDTVSGATLTENVVVTYDGDESGNFLGQTSGDNAAFDEIEGVTTGSGDDTVDASADSTGQIITTNAGTDTILGGAGGDTIDAGADDDTVDGGAGADSIAGGAGDDGILGGVGADTIDGGAGADTINGGDDADSVTGGDDQDLINLTGNFGDDTIAGGEGGTDGDTLDGGTLTEDINVTFDGDESGSFTGQTTGSDATFSEIEAINTGSGDDTVDASADSVGTTINTGAGADNVLGGAGGDTLTTGTGDDTVDGGQGADSVNAGDGDDVIQLTPGYDNDTIVGGEGGETNGDTLDGSTLAEDVVVTYDGDEQGNFVGQTTGDNADFAEIEAINTGSGDDTIDASADNAGVNIQTNAGDDSVIGGQGGDTLNSGAGQDTINGGAGADSINAGDDEDSIQLTDGFGDDTIAGGEGGTDDDTLAGGALTEAVTVTFNADDESGTVTNPGGDTATFSEIEAVETGSGADTIDGSASTGGINVDSGAGADTMSGGEGDDTLAAGEGADTVSGGLGADSVTGGGGDDELQIANQFGDDTIVGGETNETAGDTLDGSALTESVTVTFNNDAESGTITNPGGDSVQFSEIEAVATGAGDDTIDASASTGGVNVDAGLGNDTITGGIGADTLTGGAGSDTFASGAGDDLLDGGEDADTFIISDGFGADTIAGGEGGTIGGGVNAPDADPANDLVAPAGDFDVIDFSALSTNVDINYNASETGIANAGANSVAFSGIEKFVLTGNSDIVDGQAETDALDVDGGGGGDSLTGGAGNDRFVGGLGGDTLTGGEGDDVLEGGDGDDSLFGGDGDDKVFGGEGDDFVISTPGEDTVFGGAGGDTISVGEETDLVFGGDGADSLDGGSNDDVIFGGAGADTIEGGVPALESGVLVGGGNDTIDAGLDNDVVNAGDGDDIVAGNGGSDTIDGGVGADTIQGDAGITLVRESFNWSEIPDPDDGGVIDDADVLIAGAVQDTGGVQVTMSYTDDGAGQVIEYQNGATQNIDGIDGGAETVSSTSAGRLEGTGIGPNATTSFTFASNDPLVDDDVLNVQFRVNDIDEGTFRDTIQILAFDALGNPVEVALTGGSNLNLTDTDGVEGVDTAQAIDGTGGTSSADATNSLLVDIAGPVSRIEVIYSNGESGFQAVEITDIFFDTQVTNTTGDDDSLTGGDGDDVISGQAGDDTIDGGDGADSIEGDGDITGPETVARITEANFADTTSGYTVTAQNIEGGVLGAASVDNVGILNGTLGADGVVSDTDSGQNGQLAFDLASGLSETLIVDIDDPVDAATFDFNFLFTQGFGEVGHYAVFLDGVLVSEADFSEDAVGSGSGTVSITGVGEFDQIVFTALPQTDGTDGSDYGVSNITFPIPGDVVPSDPPGDDSIIGGAGEDTILGQEGSDTIDGGLDADLINAGDDQDTIVLTDNFGADTIAGGEGGTDGDTLDQSALSAPVGVQYTGDEAGTTTDGTSTATFSEIETQILTSFDDTLDATLDTVGVNVFAGAGEDTLLGGSGSDTIRGEAGDDTIDGGAGADSITGGDGDDELRLNDGFGDNTIIGGEGGETNGDTLAGGALTEDVTVTINADGESGTVTNPGGDSANFAEIEAFETGSGADTIDASASTVGVNLTSNAGEDVIIGGAGDDAIDAGDNDDTITFGQNDTVLGGAGADEFIVQPSIGGMGIIGDFDPTTNVDNTIIYDPANPPDQTDNDFVDLSGFFANINELRDANTPNSDGDVVLDLGDGQTLTFVGVSDVTLLNFENTNVICFTRGAKIRTVNGDIAVEDLVAGDLVETMDSGAQPIRWIGRRVISAGMLDATPRLRPVRIAKGALGASRDLMVSPQHRMLLTGDRAEMMFGADQVLAAAKDLIDGDMIHMGPADDVEYFHILFDDHEIIFAENVPTESFHPGEQALNTATAKMQAEIFELFPELAEDCVNRPTARMVLKSHEAKAFAR